MIIRINKFLIGERTDIIIDVYYGSNVLTCLANKPFKYRIKHVTLIDSNKDLNNYIKIGPNSYRYKYN